MTTAGEADETVSEASRTFRLVLEYDGRDFEGWQIQTGQRVPRTIQGTLKDAAEGLVGGPVRVRGAGRTDAGVHAFGQVASVVLETTWAPDVLGRALQSRLPGDLAIVDCQEVSRGWDALREAEGKLYRYQIWNGRHRSPVRAPRWSWVREPLSLEAMREGALAFVGTHDFASLRAAGTDTKTTVRTLTAIRIEGASGGEITLDVEGEGFLRHMVRNLAGTLIEIGRGRWAPTEAAGILAACDRGKAGPTAPAEGLCLVEVRDSFTRARCGGEATGDGRPSSVDAADPVG